MKRLTLTLVLILSGLASSSLYAQIHYHPNVIDKWPDTRYTVDADKGTVIDTVTGLMWRRCAEGSFGTTCADNTATGYTWAEALDVPAAANRAVLGGYTNWRLPNIKELKSLRASNRLYDPINTTAFPKGKDRFWSSSPVLNQDDTAWEMPFVPERGARNDSRRSSHLYVRLVRDDVPRYIVNEMSPGDTVRTVTDTTTGLMWKQCAEGLSSTDCGSNTSSVHSFSEAEQLAQDDRTGGYGDWRVPTKDELKGLIFTSTGSPHIDKDIFPNTPANAFWTSTRNGDIAAWQVDFLDATEYYGYVSEADSVRLVRTGSGSTRSVRNR